MASKKKVKCYLCRDNRPDPAENGLCTWCAKVVIPDAREGYCAMEPDGSMTKDEPVPKEAKPKEAEPGPPLNSLVLAACGGE